MTTEWTRGHSSAGMLLAGITWWPLLAEVTPNLPVPGTMDGASRASIGGVVPVIACLLVLVSLLLVWAVFFRKSQGRRERGRLLDGRPALPSPRSDSGSKSNPRRRRREKQRPRNPTLSETGGLPPIGAGDSKPPPL